MQYTIISLENNTSHTIAASITWSEIGQKQCSIKTTFSLPNSELQCVYLPRQRRNIN